MLIIIVASLLTAEWFSQRGTVFHAGVFYTNVVGPDDKEHLFLVDSGSPVSMLSPELATRAKAKGQRLRVGLRVGSQELRVTPDVGAAGTMARVFGRRTVEGILGMDVLSNLQLLLDYRDQTIKVRLGVPLTLGEASSSLSAPLAGVHRIELTQTPAGFCTVQLRTGGHELHPVLDTGSGCTMANLRRLVGARIWEVGTTQTTLWNGKRDVLAYLVQSMSADHLELPWVLAIDVPQNIDVGDGAITPARISPGIALIDFPGRAMYFVKKGIEDRQVSEALSEMTLRRFVVDGTKTSCFLVRNGARGPRLIPAKSVDGISPKRVVDALRYKPNVAAAAGVLVTLAKQALIGSDGLWKELTRLQVVQPQCSVDLEWMNFRGYAK